MPVEVKKITESRAQARENTQQDMRAAIALEQIADTLEAIRAEFVGFQQGLFRELGSRRR